MTLPSATTTETARPVGELWYTRCPVLTSSSIAISQGWVNEEVATDGITVTSLRARRDSAVRESHFDTRSPTRSARAATSRRSGRARAAETCG